MTLNGAAALNALATLSLAGSPPPQSAPQTSTSFASAVGMIDVGALDPAEEQMIKLEDPDQHSNAGVVDLSIAGITIKSGNGKKRGTTFQCESCSKVGLSLLCYERLFSSFSIGVSSSLMSH